MKMHEIQKISWNHRKSMKINEKAASWNRVKVSLRASFRLQSVATGRETPDPWNHEISWNLMKSSEIHRNPPTSPTLDDSMTRWPDSVILLDPSWLFFHRFSWISEDFMRFHGFHAFSWIYMYFLRFHEISWDFMDFMGWRLAAWKRLCRHNDSPKESFTRFQLAAIIDFHRFPEILIDFHRFSWFS